jgi:hypothetical protein
MPVLGIVASQISGHLTPPAVLAYDSIATFTLTSTSTGVTFTSIPSTYTHLQLRTVSINSTSGNRLIQVGSGSVDTGANYGIHELYGSGSSATAGSILSASNIQIFYAPPDASAAAASVTDILDYRNTNKITVTKTLGGVDLNGSGRITFGSGFWNNTAAIDTLKVFPASGNFEAGSRFALYGIKGA